MFVRGWLGQKGRAQQNAWQEEQEGTLGEAELFQILPREMWLVIFDFLSAKEACQARLVCKTWSDLAEDEMSWKRRAFKELGVQALETKCSWKDQYKRSIWSWQVAEDDSRGVMFGHNKRTAVALRGDHAVLSRQVIPIRSRSSHYFEVAINNVGAMTAVGVSGATLPKMMVYSVRNEGTGWYSYGIMWSKSNSMWSNKSFRTGDVVGIFLDLENKSLLFYKNGVAQQPAVDISWKQKDLHIACLLSTGAEVELRYLGDKPLPPPDADDDDDDESSKLREDFAKKE